MAKRFPQYVQMAPSNSMGNAIITNLGCKVRCAINIIRLPRSITHSPWKDPLTCSFFSDFAACIIIQILNNGISQPCSLSDLGFHCPDIHCAGVCVLRVSRGQKKYRKIMIAKKTLKPIQSLKGKRSSVLFFV